MGKVTNRMYDWLKKITIALLPWVIVIFMYDSPLLMIQEDRSGLSDYLIPFLCFTYSLAFYVFSFKPLKIIEKCIVTILFAFFMFFMITVEQFMFKDYLLKLCSNAKPLHARLIINS